jgi:predicted nucleic acid-binding protein
MMVLVDTPIWSLALRRRPIDLSASERLITNTLSGLVRQRRIRLLGPTRQEVLSGIRDESQFLRIRDHLRGFANVELDASDYEEAARANNRCRGKGVAGSPVDLLICAVALRYGWQIFTTDHDFERYRSVLDIRLYLPSKPN